MEAGTIAVNDWYFPAPDTPFGGVKQSGYGREGGLEGLNDYLQTKTIQINSTYNGLGDPSTRKLTTRANTSTFHL